jgi:hypothetical protein
MTITEMKLQIREYCLKIILNSKKENWQNYKYEINNIEVTISDSWWFNVKIYHDKDHQQINCEIYFNSDKFLFVCNKKERQEIKKLKEKHHEIMHYLKNKQLYDSTLITYNLLPIKEIRKNKLENIKNI